MAHVEPNSLTDDQLRNRLEQSDCRPTSQRVAVLRALLEGEAHPTAEQVFAHLRHRREKISLATVYNALEALVQHGLATRLVGSDALARFDVRTEEHYHLRDVNTGEVRDLPAPFDPSLLEKLDPTLVQRLKDDGFEVTGYRLEVQGRFKDDC